MQIKQGDKIRITSQGHTIEGTVNSSHNFGGYAGKPDCWYIEFTDGSGHPHYWKEDIDGGIIEKGD